MMMMTTTTRAMSCAHAATSTKGNVVGVVVVARRGSSSSSRAIRRGSGTVTTRAKTDDADDSDVAGDWIERGKRAMATLAVSATIASAGAMTIDPGLAYAVSSAKKTEMQETGACLLQNCGRELAACVTDEKCLEDLVCLQGCFGKEDEGDCQIRCGDLYASQAVATFNTCAVTEKSCVAQRKDEGKYPVPPFDALAEGFTLDTMVKEKRWYIVAGLNKDFDTFDCQEHFFDKGDDGKMYIKINWRVNRPNGQFYERSDVQRFYQEPDGKAILHNNGNVMLHYQDDWYIPAFKEGEWVYIYYRGTNDAWDGYGGATVYATSPDLKPEWIPDLEAASKKVGVKWSDFVITDNSCKPAPELKLTRPTDLDTLADDARVLEKDIESVERVVEKDVKRFESFVATEFNSVEKNIESIEQNLFSAGPGRPAGFVTDAQKKKMNAELDAKDRRLFDRYSKRLDKLQDSMSSP
jgi:violaxanthin de-epoxidase